MKAYKYKKVIELVKDFQWDSANAEQEAENIASEIVKLFTKRFPHKVFSIFECEFSKHGIKSFNGNRKGKVVGESRNKKNWRVVWNNNKEATAYHKSFIIKTNLTSPTSIEE